MSFTLPAGQAERIAHAAMETFLVLNGYEIEACIDEQETIFRKLAAARLSREDLSAWVQTHIKLLQRGEGSVDGS